MAPGSPSCANNMLPAPPAKPVAEAQAFACASSASSLLALPEELVLTMLSFLDARSLARVRSVCSFFADRNARGALTTASRHQRLSLVDKAARHHMLRKYAQCPAEAERWRCVRVHLVKVPRCPRLSLQVVCPAQLADRHLLAGTTPGCNVSTLTRWRRRLTWSAAAWQVSPFSTTWQAPKSATVTAVAAPRIATPRSKASGGCGLMALDPRCWCLLTRHTARHSCTGAYSCGATTPWNWALCLKRYRHVVAACLTNNRICFAVLAQPLGDLPNNV